MLVMALVWVCFLDSRHHYQLTITAEPLQLTFIPLKLFKESKISKSKCQKQPFLSLSLSLIFFLIKTHIYFSPIHVSFFLVCLQLTYYDINQLIHYLKSPSSSKQAHAQLQWDKLTCFALILETRKKNPAQSTIYMWL